MLSAIGDAVHVLPVIASLRDAWPGVRIGWAIQPDRARTDGGAPRRRRVPAVRAFAAACAGSSIFGGAVRERHFDLVIDLQVYFKAGVLTALLSADRKLGFDRARARDLNWLFTTERIPPHEPQHVQDQYLEFVEYLGVEPRLRWDFHFTEEELARRDAVLGRFDRPALAVVLRTTRPGKNWLADRYARVLEIAEQDLGLQPVLVGSAAPAEVEMATEVTRRTRAEPGERAGERPAPPRRAARRQRHAAEPRHGAAPHRRGLRHPHGRALRLHRPEAGRAVPPVPAI